MACAGSSFALYESVFVLPRRPNTAFKTSLQVWLSARFKGTDKLPIPSGELGLYLGWSKGTTSVSLPRLSIPHISPEADIVHVYDLKVRRQQQGKRQQAGWQLLTSRPLSRNFPNEPPWPHRAQLEKNGLIWSSSGWRWSRRFRTGLLNLWSEVGRVDQKF